MTDAQWVPTNDDIANARVTDFARFVGGAHRCDGARLPLAVAVVGGRLGRVLDDPVGLL